MRALKAPFNLLKIIKGIIKLVTSRTNHIEMFILRVHNSNATKQPQFLTICLFGKLVARVLLF